MALDKNQLGRDEVVIASMHTHVKALLGPALILILLGAGLGASIAMVPPEWQPWPTYVAVAVALVLFLFLVLIPFLRWVTSSYTITDRRIITRRGIINKLGHDLPLRRINNVNYERSLTDRMLGCGTLILETAAGQPLRLPDVPDVEQVHVTITELLFQDQDNSDE